MQRRNPLGVGMRNREPYGRFSKHTRRKAAVDASPNPAQGAECGRQVPTIGPQERIVSDMRDLTGAGPSNACCSRLLDKGPQRVAVSVHSGEEIAAIANFSVEGTEYVVVRSRASQANQMEIVGVLEINGRKFAVGRYFDVTLDGDPLAALTPRELEIARCIAAGYQAKSIAQRLRISYYTVRVHVGRIYCKLGLHKQTELASWISAQLGRQRIDGALSGPAAQVGRIEEEKISG